jgi:hypothetical protein
MRSLVGLVLGALAIGASCEAGVRTIRIADRIMPVCSSPDQGPAQVIVHVLDHEGGLLHSVSVEITWRKPSGLQPLVQSTDAAGVARFTLERTGEVRLTAHVVGFAVSVAERVAVRRGCLSAISLPLEIEPPKEILTTPGR